MLTFTHERAVNVVRTALKNRKDSTGFDYTESDVQNIFSEIGEEEIEEWGGPWFGRAEAAISKWEWERGTR